MNLERNPWIMDLPEWIWCRWVG